MICVYCLTSPSGKRYVGVTSQGLGRRWAVHCSDARRGSKVPLHRAIRKYGAAGFHQELIARASDMSSAFVLERHWIVRLGTASGGGYNATFGGEGCAGSVRSPETRARMRVAAAARMTDEAREHLRTVNTGRCVSEETRAKMRTRTQGLATRDKQRAAWTPERRAAQAARMKGRPKSAETRAKLSASHCARARGEVV
jgi:group I intron endonuclease